MVICSGFIRRSKQVGERMAEDEDRSFEMVKPKKHKLKKKTPTVSRPIFVFVESLRRVIQFI